MEFSDLMQRALHIRQQYAELEQAQLGRSWTNSDIALGFVVDVGDLMRLIMASNGTRQIPDAEAKLAHELADCLWSVLVLAQLYHVDLEQAFLQTMNDLEQRITAQKQTLPKPD
jgi:NTP pyrophosphatase (non-canonical NTP hydrolase)